MTDTTGIEADYEFVRDWFSECFCLDIESEAPTLPNIIKICKPIQYFIATAENNRTHDFLIPASHLTTFKSV